MSVSQSVSQSVVWESVEFNHFSTIKREIGASGGEHAVISYHVSYLVRYERTRALSYSAQRTTYSGGRRGRSK